MQLAAVLVSVQIIHKASINDDGWTAAQWLHCAGGARMQRCIVYSSALTALSNC